MTAWDWADGLRARVHASRGCGVVHLEARGRAGLGADDDPRAVADALVRSLGLRPIGAAWRERSSAEALADARNVLHRDLAYRGELMPEALAAQLAAEFLARFEPNARFFTNAVFPPVHETADVTRVTWMGSWDPVTNATFDTGIVAVDERQAGLLWVEDED